VPHLLPTTINAARAHAGTRTLVSVMSGTHNSLRLDPSGDAPRERQHVDSPSGDAQRPLQESPPGVRGDVHHAIALFRRHDATVESKRSAIFNLARVLEERRSLIKEHLKKDEGALFEIANRFDLRHRRADQKGEYDEAFLDWIFWWYLGTVELTNQLIASRNPSP
jgi:hypothetical protein